MKIKRTADSVTSWPAAFCHETNRAPLKRSVLVTATSSMSDHWLAACQSQPPSHPVVETHAWSVRQQNGSHFEVRGTRSASLDGRF